ncbi:hypothetical protein ACU4GD_39255 [Cupriavidus basilensis]
MPAAFAAGRRQPRRLRSPSTRWQQRGLEPRGGHRGAAVPRWRTILPAASAPWPSGKPRRPATGRLCWLAFGQVADALRALEHDGELVAATRQARDLAFEAPQVEPQVTNWWPRCPAGLPAGREAGSGERAGTTRPDIGLGLHGRGPSGLRARTPWHCLRALGGLG